MPRYRLRAFLLFSVLYYHIVDYPPITMSRAKDELVRYIEENGNEAQWSALQIALRAPRGLANARLRNRKGPILNRRLVSKPMSFTLDQRTTEWLNQHPRGMKSSLVEIALARYRVWPIMWEFIDALVTELEEVKK